MAATDIFMDSGGFLSLWDASDEHHRTATRLHQDLARKHRRFITSEYIIDETATLLLVRHSHAAASDFLKTVEASPSLQVEWIGTDRFWAAATLFQRHSDKEWSFTDCISFNLMREMRIRDAFTTDTHFRQAGFVPLLRP